MSLGAGCIWREAYEAVTTAGGRYVQGGGCTTVGVAGLVQGGGFGSFSKTFGSAAASLLEAEIVTADGAVAHRQRRAGAGPLLGAEGRRRRHVRRRHPPDAAPPMICRPPSGVARWSMTAASDAAFLALLDRFIDLYAERLFNPTGASRRAAAPATASRSRCCSKGWTRRRRARRGGRSPNSSPAAPPTTTSPRRSLVIAIPARKMWDAGVLAPACRARWPSDERPDGSPGHWWWAGQHRGGRDVLARLPICSGCRQTCCGPDRRAAFAKAWFDASRHWSTSLHFNKGLAGAPPEAIERSRATATNPQVLDAFALAIIAMDGPSAYPPLPAPNLAEARDDQARIIAAMAELRKVAPGAGSYMSECDYHLANWREACWGPHAARLAAIKRRLDPDDLFIVHHGVGSERWSEDGFRRLT